MSTALTLFPAKAWTTAEFSVLAGNNVKLQLADDEDAKYELTLFIRGSSDKETNALALLLKEAAAKLEVVCGECGQVKREG